MTPNATVWSYLGPTEEQRFYVMQVSLGGWFNWWVKKFSDGGGKR